MKKRRYSVILTFLLIALLLLSAAGCGKGNKSEGPWDYKAVKKDVAERLAEDNPSPGISPVGGDWLIYALAKSGEDIDETYFDAYRDNVRLELKRKKGILSETKYTEYERVILALHSIGQDYRDVEGYDLTAYLDDYEKVSGQGVNAETFALITMNTCGFDLENEARYMDDVLEELIQPIYMEDPEMTDYISMGMDALGFYAEREEVQSFMEKGIEALSKTQTSDGSLGNCESTVECIITLTGMGVDPLKDERFIKDGKTLLDGLFVYYLGDGNFIHELPKSEGEKKMADPMATEKALLALDALELFEKGKKLYE